MISPLASLGARPRMSLVICGAQIAEIWVEGRAPVITIHDYDWSESDLDPSHDVDGFPFTKITWRRPAWALGLSLHPPAKETPMAKPTLKHIPLSDLKISKLNMRHSRKRPDTSDILPSIRKSGIRQTLLVRREGDHYGVIAGRRRFFALQEIAKETSKTPLVPCAIMTETDAATAIEASVIENVGRLPATEMEQYTAFKHLHDENRSVADIATFFGVTELTVRRVLALANLADPIRKLYAAESIDRETIRALTLASITQQEEWLCLYKDKTEREPYGRNCRAWVTGGVSITTDKALFELEGYDGQITADLFGEHGVFADIRQFWKAQSKAVGAQVETYIKRGWRDVHCLERGAYFNTWDHEKRSRKDGGMVFVELRNDGSVTFFEGYLTKTDARKMDRMTSGETDKTPKAIRPEMSGPMAQYILLHRHGATRATLLQHPSIALRLMVAHVMVGSTLWNVNAHFCTAKKQETRESIAASKAEIEIEAARAKVEAMFAALGVNGKAARNSDDYHLCEVFSALLAMSDDEVGTVLAYTMAETLGAGSGAVEAVAHVTNTSMADYWKPEPAFFDLLRDKRAVNAMVGDIASPIAAQSCLTETAKVQRTMIGNRIIGQGCEPQPDWRPGWMQVPPTRLVSGAGSAPADAWERVASLFEAEEESLSSEHGADTAIEIAA